jgi:hypothetical protein
MEKMSRKKKYSKGFERDFKWYMSMRHRFNFDGHLDRDIEYDPKGVDGKKAFHKFDSSGRLVPTKHPNILRTLLKTKGSTNLHIKMYAEDRAKNRLPLLEFRGMCIQFKAPYWFREAVEHQKSKYY